MAFVNKIEEMKLRHLRTQFGDMTLDEVTELAQQADSFLKDMTIFDPAWEKFKTDSRRWWQYAWLISCEHGSMCPSDPYIRDMNFLVAFPWVQSHLDECDYRKWLRERKEDVCVEFNCYMPVYLRDDEIDSYAIRLFHCHNDIAGVLCNVEIERIDYKD